MNCVQFLAQLAGVLENAQEKLSSLVFLLFCTKSSLSQMYLMCFSPQHSTDCDIFFKTPPIIMQMRITIHMFCSTFVWHSNLNQFNFSGG